MEKRYSHILWDFNGTILNDMEAGIRSENTLLARRGMKQIQSLEQYRSLFTFPISEYYRKLGHDFEKEPYHSLAEEWVAEYLMNAAVAGLQEGVSELLEKFRQAGCRQLILSATERQMLFRQVKALGIDDYFCDILGLDNIHAYSKIEIGVNWMKQERPDQALMIGDTIHDFQVAQAMGVECVLVAAGHQSFERLQDCGVPVYHSLAQLAEALWLNNGRNG